MLHRLLVPLDGAQDSEAALPLAAFLAEKSGAAVTLLHVLEAHPPQSVHGQRHLHDQQTAQQYLQEVAEKFFPASTKIDFHVHTPAVSKLSDWLEVHVEEYHADLVIMCAHGPVRLRDRLVGNLAQQIIASRACPVLMARPNVARPPSAVSAEATLPPAAEPYRPFKRILVPLDGLPQHEAALPLATYIAQALPGHLGTGQRRPHP